MFFHFSYSIIFINIIYFLVLLYYCMPFAACCVLSWCVARYEPLRACVGQRQPRWRNDCEADNSYSRWNAVFEGCPQRGKDARTFLVEYAGAGQKPFGVAGKVVRDAILAGHFWYDCEWSSWRWKLRSVVCPPVHDRQRHPSSAWVQRFLPTASGANGKSMADSKGRSAVANLFWVFRGTIWSL